MPTNLPPGRYRNRHRKDLVVTLIGPATMRLAEMKTPGVAYIDGGKIHFRTCAEFAAKFEELGRDDGK